MQPTSESLRQAIEEQYRLSIFADVKMEIEVNGYYDYELNFPESVDSTMFTDDSVMRSRRPFGGLPKLIAGSGKVQSTEIDAEDIDGTLIYKKSKVWYRTPGVESKYKYFRTDDLSANTDGEDGFAFEQPQVFEATYDELIDLNKLVIGFEYANSLPVFIRIELFQNEEWQSIGEFVPNDLGAVVVFYDGFWTEQEVVSNTFTSCGGIRITVEEMDAPSEAVELIQVSPRLIFDLSDRVVDYSLNRLRDQVELDKPLGVSSASTSSLTLENTDGFFNNENEDSPLYGLIDVNVKFIIQDSIDVNGEFQKIPQIIGYANSWDFDAQGQLSVDLSDYSKFFQSEKLDNSFYQRQDIRFVIADLVERAGIVEYEIRYAPSDAFNRIPYIFFDKELSIWQTLQDVALAEQAVFYFDESGIFIWESRDYLWQKNQVDLELIGNIKDDKLPNIVSYSYSHQTVANVARVFFTPTDLLKFGEELSNNFLWELDEETVLISFPLISDVEDESQYIEVIEDVFITLPDEGVLNVEAEFIRYSKERPENFDGEDDPQNVLYITERGVYNSTKTEHYTGTNEDYWKFETYGWGRVVAAGGEVDDIVDPVDGREYRVHTFTDVGTSDFVVTKGGQVEYLVVAGGGGGGSARFGSDSAGGGGAGGVLTGVLTVGRGSLTVAVGAGGAGGLLSADAGGVNGGNSVFGSVTAIGGGGGGGVSTGALVIADAKPGGSGGGAFQNGVGGAGTEGQGFAGGVGFSGPPPLSRGGGGGGGATEQGGDSQFDPAVVGGKGGDGLVSTITGSSLTVGGGGGGGARSGTAGAGGAGGGGAGSIGGAGFDATVNTGGGGGGAGGDGTTGGDGGAGGSGIVIIRYPLLGNVEAEGAGGFSYIEKSKLTIDSTRRDRRSYAQFISVSEQESFDVYGTQIRFPMSETDNFEPTYNGDGIAGIVFNAKSNEFYPYQGYYVELVSSEYAKSSDENKREVRILKISEPLADPVLLAGYFDADIDLDIDEVQEIFGAELLVFPGKDYKIEIILDRGKVLVESIERNKLTINVVVNGTRIFSYTDVESDENPVYTEGSWGVYARGNTEVNFEYVFAVDRKGDAARLSRSQIAIRDVITGGFNDNVLEEFLREHNALRNEFFFDDFGAFAREVREFDVNHDIAPAVSTNLFVSNDTETYLVYYRRNQFSSDFAIGNRTRGPVVLSGDDVRKELSATMAVYGVPIEDKEQDEEEFRDDKSVWRRGESEVSVESRWIQTKAQARRIGEWIVERWGRGVEFVSIETTVDPRLQLGDVVSIDMPENDLYGDTNRFHVISIDKSVGSTPSQNMLLRRVEF